SVGSSSSGSLRKRGRWINRRHGPRSGLGFEGAGRYLVYPKIQAIGRQNRAGESLQKAHFVGHRLETSHILGRQPVFVLDEVGTDNEFDALLPVLVERLAIVAEVKGHRPDGRVDIGGKAVEG